MNHFLARLVQRARGTAARVEPLVTPRFAPTPVLENAFQVEAQSQTWRDQTLNVERGSPPRAVIQQEASTRKIKPKVLRETEKSSLLPAKVASDPKPEQLLVPPTKAPADSSLVVRGFHVRDRAPLFVKNGAMKKKSVVTVPARRLRSATPNTTAFRNLEHGAVMPNELSEQPPIVRVTIGRIDVRAISPAVPVRKSSTRSEPKLTLDAYLKARREGAR